MNIQYFSLFTRKLLMEIFAYCLFNLLFSPRMTLAKIIIQRNYKLNYNYYFIRSKI